MWIKQLGSPGNDFSDGIAIDANHNLFISGTTDGSLGNTNAGNSDIWVAKYDSQGNLLWNQQFGTPDLERFQGVATDLNGDVYISGSTLRTVEGSFTIDSDAWIAKYDSQGNLLWNQQLGSPSGSETSTGVATSLNGDLYISGSTRGTPGGGGSSAWLIKYDSQGNLLSNQQLELSGAEVSAGLAIDNSGSIYLSGVTDGALNSDGTDETVNDTDSDALLAKYDSQGNLLWTQKLGSSEYDYSQAVTTDSSGNVYITGGTNGNINGANAGLNDAWVAKYDSQGNLLWKRQLGTAGNDSSEDVAVDDSGNVYISGATNDILGEANVGGSDAWVAKYDSQGNLLWTEQFGAPEDDYSQGVVLDNSNNLYLSGYTEGTLDGLNAGGRDAWIRQISQAPITDNTDTNTDTNDNNDGSDSLLKTPINRFQNNSRPGTYLFAGPEESQDIRANFSNFIEEGQAFKVATEPGDSLIRLNRFQNLDVPGTYLYAGEEESQDIRANFSNFLEEGIAFYVYPGSADIGVDFYRFQNSNVPGTYIFVGGEERQDILDNFPHFVEEGIAFEVGT